jgi:hypothetical protein
MIILAAANFQGRRERGLCEKALENFIDLGGLFKQGRA